MITRITNMHGDLQRESSGWLFKSLLAGGGGILWRPHYRQHSLLLLSLFGTSDPASNVDNVCLIIIIIIISK